MATILLSYKLGIDIGSRTVKVTVLNTSNAIVMAHGLYHQQKIYSAMVEALRSVCEKIGNMQCTVGLTGNGAPVIAHRTRLFYVNEESAVAHLVQQTVEAADMTIEVGAAGTYVHELTSGRRWNVDTLLGRGDFIQMMATALDTDLPGFNALAEAGEAEGRISFEEHAMSVARIQAYLSDGVQAENLAAEACQAMAKHLRQRMDVSEVNGKVAFVGVCFEQVPALREAYVKALELVPENVLALPDASLCASSGAARLSESQGFMTIEALIERLTIYAKEEGTEEDMTFEDMELNFQRAGLLSMPDRQELPKRAEKWRQRLSAIFSLG